MHRLECYPYEKWQDGSVQWSVSCPPPHPPYTGVLWTEKTQTCHITGQHQSGELPLKGTDLQ